VRGRFLASAITTRYMHTCDHCNNKHSCITSPQLIKLFTHESRNPESNTNYIKALKAYKHIRKTYFLQRSIMTFIVRHSTCLAYLRFTNSCLSAPPCPIYNLTYLVEQSQNLGDVQLNILQIQHRIRFLLLPVSSYPTG
jgi:hypothetical protein